jgi:hypothetical protein
MFAPEAVAGVPSAQVLKDFKRDAKSEPGQKILSTKYVGHERNFQKVIGLVPVDFTAYEVEEVVLYEECGTKMKFGWEVWYRKSGGKLVYDTNATLDMQVVSTPPAPAPLEEQVAIEQISGSFQKASSPAKIINAKIGSQKGSWNFCDNKWEIESVVTLTEGDTHEAMHDKYECPMVTEVYKRKGKLEPQLTYCLDSSKSNQRVGCYFPNPNHCKNLGKVSVVSEITWSPKVEEAIKTRVCEGYGYDPRKDCKVEGLSLVSAGKSEQFFNDPAKRFMVQWQPSFDEINHSTAQGRQPRVRSRYQCKGDVVVVQRYTGSEWNLSAQEVHVCPPNKTTCDDTLNPQVSFWELCSCLGPQDHCDAALGRASAASAIPSAPVRAAPAAQPASKSSWPSLPGVPKKPW